MFKGYTLTKGIIVGVLLGLLGGLLLKEKMAYFKVLGDLFLRLMQMPIILLIMCAVSEAVGSLKPRELGRLGGKALTLFAITTAFAGIMGLAIAFILKPGMGLQANSYFTAEQVKVPVVASFTDQILGFIPNNMFAAIASGNNLQCVIIAILFGVALSLYGSKHEENPVLEWIKQLNKIVTQLIFIIVQLLPVAAFSFIGYAVGVVGPSVLQTLAKLIFANLLGVTILLVLFATIACLYCGVSVIKFFPKIARMAFIALMSASSAVTLPTKMEDSEKLIGISPRINRLVAPLGMSMNSDGAVLFFCLSAVTVAQVFNITMTEPMLINLVIFSTLLSFATISVPGGGLVMFAMVLNAVGLPAEGMVIVAAADFFLGPIRTVGNSVDDVMVAMLVAKSEGEFDADIYNGIKKLDNEQNN